MSHCSSRSSSVEDIGVEQLAQLGLAQQLGQQPGVQGEGGGAALGERGVALVQELGDVAEEEGAGEGGRLRGGDLDQADPAGLDVAHQLGEPGDVEDVLEAFADGLQDDRERAELARHLEQLGGALTLLPQRGALAGVAAGQQQGAGGALAEAGGEQRGAADLVGDDLVDLALVEERRRPRRSGACSPSYSVPACTGSWSSRSRPIRSASGSRSTMPSSACMTWASMPYRSESRAPSASAQGAWTCAPKGEWTTTRQSPSSSRKRSTTIVRSSGTWPQAWRCSSRYESTLSAAQASRPGGQQPQPGVLLGQGADLAQERAHRPAQFERAAELVALPEGQPARDAGGGGDQHAVAGDVLDPPGAWCPG